MSAARRTPAGKFAGQVGELRYHWGTAYEIWHEDGRYRAVRRDGLGSELADLLPAGLRLRISADYAACPVPRDLPEGQVS